MQAPCALTREEKETQVASLQTKLRGSMLVYGWRYTDSKVHDASMFTSMQHISAPEAVAEHCQQHDLKR